MTVTPLPGVLPAHLAGRDPAYVALALPLVRLAMSYFRPEVRDVDRVPDGGVLVVSNHSGGLLPMDVPIFAMAMAAEFGVERPVYCLAHDLLLLPPMGMVLRRCGFAPASRANAAALLAAGGATIVFPGGDYDTFRPSSKANVIDFNGRTGYVRTAIEAGVPIVPVVSIGGQQAQWFLTRGESINKLLHIEKLFRSRYFPISFGFPFGLTAAFPPNLPLPTKIVTQVLEPIHIEAEFGADPDVDEVDRTVRQRMQTALDELARRRRFPVLG